MIPMFRKDIKKKLVNRIVLICSSINVNLNLLFPGFPKMFQKILSKNIKRKRIEVIGITNNLMIRTPLNDVMIRTLLNNVINIYISKIVLSVITEIE